MTKADLLAALRAACADLEAVFARLPPESWATPDAAGVTPHDRLNYAMGLLELTGNWYLQTLRLPTPPDHTALADALRQHVARRRQRAVATDLADYRAAAQGLLILVDMAAPADLAGMVQGRSRADWLADVATQLERLRDVLRA